MARFKILWSGTIFATSFIDADNKEKAIQKAEEGKLDFDNINDIDDIEIEECDEIS